MREGVLTSNPSETATRVYIGLMGKPGTALQSVRTKLQAGGEIEFLELEQSSQVVAQLQNGEPLLLICSVTERKHILETIATLKASKTHLARKRLRVMIVSAIKQQQILSKFHENGAQDIMTEPVTEKALDLKLRRHVQATQKLKKESAGLSSLAVKAGSKSNAATDANGKRSAAGGELAKRSDPIAIQSDCWLMLSGVGKRVMGKWIFNLAGPAPTVARWVERKTTGDEPSWVWTQNVDDGRFIKEKGSWIFRGQRPEVRGDVWAFVGKAPELAFVTPEGETLARRLYCDEQGQLFIAKDSSAALSQLALIRSTWDKIIKTKAEAEAEKQEIRAKKRAGSSSDSAKEEDPLSSAITLETREESLGQESDSSEPNEPEELDQSELLAAANRVDRTEADEPVAATEPEITETTDEIAKILEEEALKQSEEMEPILEEEAMALALQDAEKDAAKAEQSEVLIFKRERKKSKELRGEFEKDALSPELRGEFAAEAEGAEREATQEGGGPGREMRATLERETQSPELRGTFSEAPAGNALEASQENPGLSPKVEKALRPTDEDSPEIQAELERLSSVSKQSKFRPTATEQAKRKGERKEFTPEMVEARTEPFAPQLSGLALVFLAGEQACKTGRSLEEMAVKFCEYINMSLSGTAVELWSMGADGQLRCVGSDLGSRGTLEAIAREGLEGMQAGSVWFRTQRAGEGVVPVETSQGLKVGLVLSGVCVAGMSEEYARALQTAARGIALGVVLSAA